MIIITAIAMCAFFVFRRWRAGIALGTGVVIGTVASETLKTLVDRPRPADHILAAGSDSFPSGHTTIAAVFAITLALVADRAIVWVLACAWVLVMAWSRTYLAMHWLSDTMAGALLGASVAIVAVAVISYISPRRSPSDEPDAMSEVS
jgi:undecaprenyl-diphosphatase